MCWEVNRVAEIRIKKNGKWYFGGNEMFRRKILNVLAANIVKTDDNSYMIKLGEDTNPLVVEDVPFYATGLVEDENKLKLVFFDLQELVLDHEQKLYFKGDVPYITYKWPGDTRLSRGVYWKLSDFFVFRGEDVYIVPPSNGYN